VRDLSSTVRVLLKRGQHPIAKGLQAIVRHGRTSHLHDGRAVLRPDLDPQQETPFVGTHYFFRFSARVTGASTEPTRAFRD